MKTPAKRTKKPAPTASKTEAQEALAQVVSYLKKRDHSRFELRQKLERRFPAGLTQRTLAEAEQRGWLDAETRIAERAAEACRRRQKSQAYLEAHLKKRGLPPVGPDPQKELENLTELLDKRFGPKKDLDTAEKQKAALYLSRRGFDEQLIRMVLYE